jgi:riboflavin biosynthesis pyrimidine reductase
LNLRLPVFSSGKVPVMIITTARGAKRLLKRKLPESLHVHTIRRRVSEIPAHEILAAVGQIITGRRILVEGGPRLLGTFYKERLLDEQFLSLAPQLSGREIGDARMGLVMGETFAPSDPLWGTLIDARAGRRLLFLRYAFA